jgi:putative hydrolase of the HAD superfamily
LLFDLGKVVFDLSFDRVFASWAAGGSAEANALKAAFHTVAEHDRFERGEITPAQFRDAVRMQLALRISDADLDNGWCDLYLDAYPGMEELLGQLSRRARLAAFTNTNAIHEPVWRKRYAHVLARFERIFCSHLIGARKPEPAAYAHVLSQLGARPAEVLFLDDNEANVQGARACGIEAIHVTTLEAMRAELAMRGMV